MGINENEEINKVISFLKEHSINAILEKDDNSNKEDVIKDLEELFEQVKGPLCEQLKKLPVLDLTKDYGEIIKRDGKLNADIHVSYNQNEIGVNFEFWPKLMKFILSNFVADESHYIEFSCYDTEEEIISEIKEKLESFELRSDSWCNLIWVKGKLNDKAKKLILENYLSDEGKIKWSVITLNSDDKKSNAFTMFHYGADFNIWGLFKEDVNSLEDIFSFNKAPIIWSED